MQEMGQPTKVGIKRDLEGEVQALCEPELTEK